MTITQALPAPHLELPTPEDVMEVTSEFDRRPNIDEDIDIDIDFANEQLHDQDNDYIIEDAKSEAGTGTQGLSAETGNDDVMLDEEGSPAEIHDDTLVQDEDIDVTGDLTENDANRKFAQLQEDADQYKDEHNDEVLRHGHHMTLLGDPLDTAPADDLEEHVPEAPDNPILGFQQEETLSTLDVDADANAKALEQRSPDVDTDVPVGSLSERPQDEPNGSKIRASAGYCATGPLASDIEPEAEWRPEAASNNPGSLHVDISTQKVELADAVTTVHPVVVIYQGSEISLFPPSDQSDSATFFVHDESLASNSISDLLIACKRVLADSISDEDELELRIEELGLCISEDSHSASSTTLSQILNVYLQLLHQDGISDVGPLYMLLTVKPNFSKRFSALLDAANKGKGISQLPYWEISSDDDAATVTDADAVNGFADEETEAPGEVLDKHNLGTVDDALTQESLRAPNNRVSALQDNSAVSVPSPKSADSHNHEAGRSTPAPGDIGTSLVVNSTPDTSVAPGIGTKTQDRTSLPGNASGPRGSHDEVTSHDLDRADDEEGDLIDYEDGDEPVTYDSTGSSTLAGDDVIEALNDHALNNEADPVTTSKALGRTENLSDNIATETAETHHIGNKDLSGRNDDLNFQVNGFQHADNEKEDNGHVDGDQLSSINAKAKQSEYFPQSPGRQDLDGSAGLEPIAHDEDDGEDSADTSKIHELRDDGPIDESEQGFQESGELLDERDSRVEEEQTTPRPQQSPLDGHEEILKGPETTTEYLEEITDDLSPRDGVPIATSDESYAVADSSAADADVITYEDDEFLDFISDQEGDEKLELKLPSSLKPASTKRSREENEVKGAADDSSQDAKRVRSA